MLNHTTSKAPEYLSINSRFPCHKFHLEITVLRFFPQKNKFIVEIKTNPCINKIYLFIFASLKWWM